jgi:hypothetical protein
MHGGHGGVREQGREGAREGGRATSSHAWARCLCSGDGLKSGEENWRRRGSARQKAKKTSAGEMGPNGLTDYEYECQSGTSGCSGRSTVLP